MTLQIFTKAIFISFFFHMAVLGTVVFSFTISQGQAKPFFIFLGSILPKQDFILPEGSYARTGTHLQPSPQILMGTKHPLYPAPVSKPSFQSNVFSREKKLLKMRAFSAADQPEDKNSSETIEKNLGIERRIPPYAPLKLYPPSQKTID